MALTDRRIAVTGAAGFVGGWLMSHLAEVGAEPVSFFEPGQYALGDPAQIGDILDRLKPDVVVHLAAIAAPGEAQDNPRSAFDVNLGGTLNLAEAIIARGGHTRLLFAGSSEVYGHSFNLSDAPLGEDARLEPQTLYGVTKASADLLLGQMASGGLDVVRFRPFNHTGPGQTEAYVVPAFARQIARIEAGLQEPIIEVGDLNAERDFLDVRDVVRAYGLAALRPEPLSPGTVLNLASGQPRKIEAILRHMLALSTVAIEVRVDPARVRPASTPRAVGDAAKARASIDWTPVIPFEQTLEDVLNSWRSLM